MLSTKDGLDSKVGMVDRNCGVSECLMRVLKRLDLSVWNSR